MDHENVQEQEPGRTAGMPSTRAGMNGFWSVGTSGSATPSTAFLPKLAGSRAILRFRAQDINEVGVGPVLGGASQIVPMVLQRSERRYRAERHDRAIDGVGFDLTDTRNFGALEQAHGQNHELHILDQLALQEGKAGAKGIT